MKGPEQMARAAQSYAKNGSFDAAPYSLQELHEIRDQIDVEIASRKTNEIEALRVKVAETAQALGISIEEVFGFSTARAKLRAKPEATQSQGKLPAKYRGPAGEEWSGRGPTPKWMKPLLTKGRTKEDFLIK
jgi:DNA-binding protein H-NS